jgi:hypothetical protein
MARDGAAGASGMGDGRPGLRSGGLVAPESGVSRTGQAYAACGGHSSATSCAALRFFDGVKMSPTR